MIVEINLWIFPKNGSARCVLPLCVLFKCVCWVWSCGGSSMVGRGRAYVTTHLLVALYKAGRGGRKTGLTVTSTNLWTKGDVHAARRLEPPPPPPPHSCVASERGASMQTASAGKRPSPSHSGFGAAGSVKPNGRHSAPPTETHGDMLRHPPACTDAERLRPDREAQNTSGV